MGRWEAEPTVPDEGPVPLGSIIRVRRWSLGLTRQDVASVVGCTSGYLSVIELGTRSPDQAMVERLSAALQFQSSADLMGTSTDEITRWLELRSPTIGRGRRRNTAAASSPTARSGASRDMAGDPTTTGIAVPSSPASSAVQGADNASAQVPESPERLICLGSDTYRTH